MDGIINMNSIYKNLLAMDNFEASGQGQIIENLESILFEKEIKVEFTLPNMITSVTQKLQKKKEKGEWILTNDLEWQTFYNNYMKNLNLQQELFDIVDKLNIKGMINNLNTIHKMKLTQYHKMYENHKKEQLKRLEEKENHSDVFEYRLVQKKYEEKLNEFQILKQKFKNYKNTYKQEDQHFIIQMVNDCAGRNVLINKIKESIDGIKIKKYNINKLKVTEATHRARQQELEDKLQKLKIIMQKKSSQQPRKIRLLQLNKDTDVNQSLHVLESEDINLPEKPKMMKLFHTETDKYNIKMLKTPTFYPTIYKTVEAFKVPTKLNENANRDGKESINQTNKKLNHFISSPINNSDEGDDKKDNDNVDFDAVDNNGGNCNEGFVFDFMENINSGYTDNNNYSNGNEGNSSDLFYNYNRNNKFELNTAPNDENNNIMEEVDSTNGLEE